MITREEIENVVETEVVAIKAIGAAKKHYMEKGYEVEDGYLYVKVRDLNRRSTYKIRAIDGKEYRYKDLIKMKFSDFRQYLKKPGVASADILLAKATRYFNEAEEKYLKGLDLVRLAKKELGM